MRNSYYITTAIYYANAPLHVGHAFEIIGADVMARYQRLCGKEVFFLTGLDEHGEKIQRAADKRGVTPQALVDQLAEDFRAICRDLAISNDDLIRTTEARHKEVVEAFWRKVRAKGDIYLGAYEGLYCLRDEAYVKEGDLKDGACPSCGAKPEKLSEPAYFFRLSAYQDRLRQYYGQHHELVQPGFRRTEMLRMLEAGLEDVCISRSTIRWGIPVPDVTGHVVYVWFDALVNYVSAPGWLGNPEKFSRYWPADMHIVGKDILRWHALLWPAMLMAVDMPLPKSMFGHGFFYIGGSKMSKSLGNVVDPRAVAAKYGAEPLRYFLMREVPFENDGHYSEEGLVERINSELANELGNLLHRTLSMTEKYFKGAIPAADPEDRVLVDEAEAVCRDVPSLMDQLQFSRALERTWDLVRRANRFVEEREPWKLAKDPAAAPRLASTMYQLAESLRLVAALVEPFMPTKAAAMRTQLGLDPVALKVADELRWGLLKPGTATKKGDPLFPRIETAKPAKQRTVDGRT